MADRKRKKSKSLPPRRRNPTFAREEVALFNLLEETSPLRKKLGEEKGEQSEEMVFKILELWKTRGWIRDFNRFKKGNKGSDGSITFLDGGWVRFDVKSSRAGMREYEEKRITSRTWLIPRFPGETIDILDQRMQKMFKKRLALANRASES